jgi:hypothetical protein
MVTFACNKDPDLERIITDIPNLVTEILAPALDRFLQKISCGRDHYSSMKSDFDTRPLVHITPSTFSECLGKRTEQIVAKQHEDEGLNEQNISKRRFLSTKFNRHQQAQSQTQIKISEA